MRLIMTTVLAGCMLSGCAVIAVADLAVTTVATVAKAGVKTAGAVVGAVIPDKKEEQTFYHCKSSTVLNIKFSDIQASNWGVVDICCIICE
ncbi:MAG: hypothetical protein EBX60_00080, partial [Betaproteobacteria bacterium]|nr:hypothetical protein [Betaproteobacteria bacterium]